MVGAMEKRGQTSFNSSRRLLWKGGRGFFRRVTFDLEPGGGSKEEALVTERAIGERESTILVNCKGREAAKEKVKEQWVHLKD
jgi:hypothetical protein